VSDYLAIDPDYGTMAEAEMLIEEIHKRGLRVIFDLVLNHTSNHHP
jgi:glycosidase